MVDSTPNGMPTAAPTPNAGGTPQSGGKKGNRNRSPSTPPPPSQQPSSMSFNAAMTPISPAAIQKAVRGQGKRRGSSSMMPSLGIDSQKWRTMLHMSLGILVATAWFKMDTILLANVAAVTSVVDFSVESLMRAQSYLYELQGMAAPYMGGWMADNHLLGEKRFGLHLPRPTQKIEGDIVEWVEKNGCPVPQYEVRLISREPFVAYITNFLLPEEVEHVMKVGGDMFKRSTVVAEDGSEVSDYRTSWSAFLNRHHTPVVSCIEERAAYFQGNVPITNLEPLQLVRYHPSQQYKPHYDWFEAGNHAGNNAELNRGGQRTSSFFVYLNDNCTEGETSFVRLNLPLEERDRHCDIITCDPADDPYAGKRDQVDENNLRLGGTKFIPISGNAVFWMNVDKDGNGDTMTYHAGLPVKDGEKLSMNIWTRQREFN